MISVLLLVAVLLSITAASTPVTVTSVKPIGNQTDPHLAPTYPSRDGGCVGSLGGKIVWFWADTTYTRDKTFMGFYGNTGAIGAPTNQLLMNGPQRQAIPFTSEETSFNSAHNNNPRVVLWPKSGVVEVSPGHGVLYVPKGYWGNDNNIVEPNKGIVVSTVTIGADGYPVVTRLSSIPFFALGKEPSYGSVATAKDSTYVYLYSQDSIAQYTTTTFIARVKLDSATVKSAFQYYNKAANTWDAKPPAINATSAAIFTSAFGLDGSVYYSSYHGVWLMIYNNHGDSQVRLRTAVAPEGPWINDRVVYSPPVPTAPNVTYIYGTTGTNLYDASGKTASIDFTWCYPGNYANWVAQINFA